MKKILLAFIAFFVFSAPFAFAQTLAPTASDTTGNTPLELQQMPVMYPPPPPVQQQNFLGQNHSYTVNLRGNGEAVVLFKAISANLQDQPLSEISLQFPSTVHPKDIAVFQVLEDNLPCIHWMPQSLSAPTPSPQPLMYNTSQNTSSPLTNYKLPQQICQTYQQPDFTNPDSYTTSYQKAEYVLQPDNHIIITLPRPVAVNESGSYFVYFRSFDYTQKTFFNAYNFTFETFKTNDTINNLTVGINTDADYILKDAKGKINYQGDIPASSLPLGTLTSGAVQSQQITDFYNTIGQGTIIKTESDLGTNETYKTQGIYADAQWKLYGKEIMTAIVIALFIVAIIIVGLKLLLKKMSKQQIESKDSPASHIQNHTRLFLASLGISFASTFLLFLYTMGIYFVSIFFPLFVNNIVLLMAIFAISMAVFTFFIVAPAVGIGLKKGLTWGINTFGFTILWSIIFFIATIGILFIFSNGNNFYPPPIQYLNGAGAGGAMNSTNGNSNSGNSVMGAHTQAVPQNNFK